MLGGDIKLKDTENLVNELKEIALVNKRSVLIMTELAERQYPLWTISHSNRHEPLALSIFTEAFKQKCTSSRQLIDNIFMTLARTLTLNEYEKYQAILNRAISSRVQYGLRDDITLALVKKIAELLQSDDMLIALMQITLDATEREMSDEDGEWINTLLLHMPKHIDASANYAQHFSQAHQPSSCFLFSLASTAKLSYYQMMTLTSKLSNVRQACFTPMHRDEPDMKELALLIDNEVHIKDCPWLLFITSLNLNYGFLLWLSNNAYTSVLTHPYAKEAISLGLKVKTPYSSEEKMLFMSYAFDLIDKSNELVLSGQRQPGNDELQRLQRENEILKIKNTELDMLVTKLSKRG